MGDVMNPASKRTWEVLRNFLNEMASVFPDSYFHLGGDEVLEDCWQGMYEHADSAAYMRDNGLAGGRELRKHFSEKAAEMVASSGKSAVLWDEAFELISTTPADEKVLKPSSTMVEVWRNKNTVKDV